MSEPTLLPDRAVIRLSGEGSLAFLQNIITQDVERLAPEAAIFSALLTPQGKVLADFFVADDGDALLIDCDKANAGDLIKRLTLYKLRAKISIDLDETLCVLASETNASLDAATAYRDPRHDQLGWRFIAPAGRFTSGNDYDANRVALGVPEFGKDFGPDEMFLLDVNYDALNAVSYKKGCFIGQEVSSRMKRKSEARRRTLIAEFDRAPPEKGAPVKAGETTLGELMSRAGAVALANIRMDRWEKAKAEAASIECGGQPVRLRIPAYLEQG